MSLIGLFLIKDQIFGNIKQSEKRIFTIKILFTISKKFDILIKKVRLTNENIKNKCKSCTSNGANVV